jgi:hypothetical protein
MLPTADVMVEFISATDKKKKPVTLKIPVF